MNKILLEGRGDGWQSIAIEVNPFMEYVYGPDVQRGGPFLSIVLRLGKINICHYEVNYSLHGFYIHDKVYYE